MQPSPIAVVALFAWPAHDVVAQSPPRPRHTIASNRARCIAPRHARGGARSRHRSCRPLSGTCHLHAARLCLSDHAPHSRTRRVAPRSRPESDCACHMPRVACARFAVQPRLPEAGDAAHSQESLVIPQTIPRLRPRPRPPQLTRRHAASSPRRHLRTRCAERAREGVNRHTALPSLSTAALEPRQRHNRERAARRPRARPGAAGIV
jgi:hypothetical protein